MKNIQFKRTYVIAGLVVLITIWYLVAIMLAPGKLALTLQREYGAGSKDARKKEIKYLDDDRVLDIAFDKAYFESMLVMSKTDSIGLVLDLKESSINLMIGGVKVHKARISKIKTSRFFNKIDRQAWLTLLSESLKVKSYTGTIVKEPIFVISAPKDTIEAAKRYFSPDTSQVVPAYIRMVVSNHLKLYIMQEETRSLRDFLGKVFFSVKERTLQAIKDFGKVFSCKIPDYYPHITIYIPRSDVITVYRALPDNARMSIRYTQGESYTNNQYPVIPYTPKVIPEEQGEDEDSIIISPDDTITHSHEGTITDSREDTITGSSDSLH